MLKPFLALLLLTGGGLSVSAQTLFTYGGKPVEKAQFLRVYQKNALNKKPDYSAKALREYVDLYSLFRAKVAEAQSQKLDTGLNIRREVDNYRKQLAKNYISDQETEDRLVREAYNRMKEEVHVAHILVQGPKRGDSTGAAALADSLYNALQKGASFDKLAHEYTKDEASKETNGDIGFITGLQTVYPFENAAYSTPVGKISKPFATQFGMHIIKVIDRRPTRGRVQVAQIMAVSPKSRGESGIAAARLTIDSAMGELLAGKPWSQVVKKYSQDKFSVEEEGVLKPFGVGETTPPFETAAFSLRKPGDLSQPVVTDYGVHLLKLVKTIPLTPFDSMKADIKTRVDNDARAQIAKDQYLNGIKSRYGWKENRPAYETLKSRFFEGVADTGKDAKSFRAEDYSSNQTLITLGGQNYTATDFMNYFQAATNGRVNGPKDLVLGHYYEVYANNVLQDFQLNALEKESPDYRNLLTEYRDGIMLFDLMDRNVWSKASKDTLGLQAFYDGHKDKYKWDAGFAGGVYRFNSKELADKGAALLNKQGVMSEQRLQTELQLDPKSGFLSAQEGRYEWDRFTEVPRAQLVNGKASVPQKNEDGSYTVVYIKSELPAGQEKTLDEARGYAVADYQDSLEKAWNEMLRKKYPVVVNDKVLESMVQK